METRWSQSPDPFCQHFVHDDLKSPVAEGGAQLPHAMAPGWCHPRRARNQCTPVLRRSVMEPCSTRAYAVLKQERDLHDDLELGHLIVLNNGLKLLSPDGADVADCA